MKLHTFKIGGVHPNEYKLTAEMPTTPAALPQKAVFPLGQHIGAPAKPVVKRGDKVKVGTLLAERRRICQRTCLQLRQWYGAED